MEKKILLALAMMAALCLPGAGSASADEFSYRMGRDLGERTVLSAWRNFRRDRGCSGVRELRSVVHRSARRIDRAEARFDRRDMIDYAKGYVRGLYTGLDDVADACPSRCGAVRELADEVTLIVYDELVVQVGSISRSAWRRDLPEFSCRTR
jgi:hypothetical protein